MESKRCWVSVVDPIQVLCGHHRFLFNLLKGGSGGGSPWKHTLGNMYLKWETCNPYRSSWGWVSLHTCIFFALLSWVGGEVPKQRADASTIERRGEGGGGGGVRSGELVHIHHPSMCKVREPESDRMTGRSGGEIPSMSRRTSVYPSASRLDSLAQTPNRVSNIC